MIDMEKKHENCCGCGVCASVCPVKAISMQAADDGADYPKVDYDICVKCGLCVKSCIFNGENTGNVSQKVFALALDSKENIRNSASGGAFYALASSFIDNGGVVYGAAYERQADSLNVRHVRAESKEALAPIQGSKYVQSRAYLCFEQLLDDLKNGRRVLFTGTPCQAAAVNKLAGKYRENLFTTEIICHGAPGTDLFQKYIQYFENRANARVSDFRFRDKSRGWGFNAKVTGQRGDEKFEKIIPGELSEYYYFFLNWDISRPGCYQCMFADEKRQADLTIGDYNGVQMVHPEFLEQNGGMFSEKDGISCLLVNTAKGELLLNSIRDSVILAESDMEHAVKYNEQLQRPCKKGAHQKEFFEAYRKDGWSGTAKVYRKLLGVRFYKKKLSEIIKHRNFV